MGPKFYDFTQISLTGSKINSRFLARKVLLTYRGESKRMHFNTEGGNVFFLEFTSQVALDESGLC